MRDRDPAREAAAEGDRASTGPHGPSAAARSRADCPATDVGQRDGRRERPGEADRAGDRQFAPGARRTCSTSRGFSASPLRTTTRRRWRRAGSRAQDDEDDQGALHRLAPAGGAWPAWPRSRPWRRSRACAAGCRLPVQAAAGGVGQGEGAGVQVQPVGEAVDEACGRRSSGRGISGRRGWACPRRRNARATGGCGRYAGTARARRGSCRRGRG